MTYIAEMVTLNIQTFNIDKHHTRQKKDIRYRNLVAQLHHKDKNTFNPVMISSDGLLQKQHYVHRLKYDVTIAPHSVVPVILYEFHNSKGHQCTIHTFETM